MNLFERTWLTVATLGRVQPDLDLLSRALAGMPPSEDTARGLAEWVDQSRVVLLAEHNLRAIPSAPLRDRLLGHVSRAAAISRLFVEQSRGDVCEVLRRALAADGHVLKGIAVRSDYPDPSLRHFGDIDLHFDNFDTALPFLVELRQLGWDWDSNELPWMKWEDDGIPYGQWSMVSDADTWQTPLRLDAHIGPYSVGYLGLLPLSRFRGGEFEGIPIAAPDPAECIALATAHALGNYFLVCKDINDLAMLTERHQVAAPRPRQLVRRVGGEGALAQIDGCVQTIYGYDSGQEGDTMRHPLPRVPPSGLARALHMTVLTFRQERRRQKVTKASARLPGAFIAYSRNTEPRPGHPYPRAPSAKYRNRWLCWRFVPPSIWKRVTHRTASVPTVGTEEIAGGLQLLHGRRATIARLGDDLFIPTVSGALSSHAISLAQARDR